MSNCPIFFTDPSTASIPEGTRTALTIGTFDGVHRAHQALIAEACAIRDAQHGQLAGVVTFQNHPRAVTAPNSMPPPLLTPWPRKRRLLEALGIDVLLGLRFTEQLMQTPAKEFVEELLVKRLRVAQVLCGPNFHFGHRGEGGPDLLAELAPRFGFRFRALQPVRYQGERVSSSRIRQALLDGNVRLAAELLTRPHALAAPVVTGDRLGRTIGFPTANLETPPQVLVPRDGVYAVRVRLESGQEHPGMMNLGWRPTVAGRDHRKEVHLIGYEGDLEGQELEVEFIQRLRDEVRFPNLEALKEQLARDKAAALEALGG